jgi:predicted porin
VDENASRISGGGVAAHHDVGVATLFEVPERRSLCRPREQDPLYAVQGHLVYSIGYGIWAAIDSSYHIGGRTKLNGIAYDDRQENWRLGGTLSLPLSRQHSIKLYGSTGVSTRTGSDFDAVGLVLQYRWGPGLEPVGRLEGGGPAGAAARRLQPGARRVYAGARLRRRLI